MHEPFIARSRRRGGLEFGSNEACIPARSRIWGSSFSDLLTRVETGLTPWTQMTTGRVGPRAGTREVIGAVKAIFLILSFALLQTKQDFFKLIDNIWLNTAKYLR